MRKRSTGEEEGVRVRRTRQFEAQGSPWSVAKQSMRSRFSQRASMSSRVPSMGQTRALPFPMAGTFSSHRKRW